MTTNTMTVADTIRQQLGGARFSAMTGAKNFGTLGNDLTFSLPARFAKGGINHVQIVLAADDTYTVKFSKWSPRSLAFSVISEHEGVYADQLRALFTEQTGLETSLGTMRG